MANKYTTSQPTTLEFSGDSVSAGSLPSTYEIVITPNAGEAVQASDFSIGSTLPIEVTNVTFTDTTTPLDTSNKVIATVTLAQWFTMPANAEIIEVDIDGTTHKPRTTSSFQHNQEVKANSTITVTAPTVTSPFTSSASTSTSGSVSTTTVSVDLQHFQKSNIARVTIAAAEGYYYPTDPYYEIKSDFADDFSEAIVSRTVDASNENLRLLRSIVYDLFFEMDDIPVTTDIGNRIIWHVPTPVEDPVYRTCIYNVNYDSYKDNDIIESKNQNLVLNVFGKENSTYNIKIENANGLSYDFNTNTFTRPLTISSEQTILLKSRALLEDNKYPSILSTRAYKEGNSNQHIISIPGVERDVAYTNFYKTTVTPTGSTTTSADSADQTPYVITLHQLGEVDVSVVVSGTAVASSVAANVSVPNATIKTMSNLPALSFLQKIETDNVYNNFPVNSYYGIKANVQRNGYFTTSQVLSYTVTDTVDGAFSGTTMVVDNGRGVSMIQVGDTIVDSTNGRIAAGTTIAATFLDAGATGGVTASDKHYTLSAAPSSEVADASVITFTRTVGISRQPQVTDFSIIGDNTFTNGVGIVEPSDYGAIGSQTYGLSYTVKEDVSNSNIVKLAQGDDTDFSGIVFGMTIESRDYSQADCKVVNNPNVGTDGVVILDKNVTLLKDQDVYFTADGLQLEISELEVTGAGTATPKLNITGCIKRASSVNTITSLVLSNFITAYNNPTAAAFPTSPEVFNVSFGDTVEIDPRTVCTGHTGELTISSASVTGSKGTTLQDSVSIINDGQAISYTAPQTGTVGATSSITYAVSDGINTSSNATITVTFID